MSAVISNNVTLNKKKTESQIWGQAYGKVYLALHIYYTLFSIENDSADMPVLSLNL